MKKIICFVLVFTLMIGIGMAETKIDPKRLSDEELIELYKAIETEIVERKIEKTAHLESGVYEISADIPIGEYQIVIDNTNGAEAIEFSYRSKKNWESSGNVKVEPGQYYQRFYTLDEGDRIMSTGNFDLVIKPRGAINFE